MSDLIDRQAAIEAVETKIKKWNAVDGEGYHVGLGLKYTDVIDTLTELPSAQPSLDEWCTDCSEYDSERHCCPRWNRVIRDALTEAQPERKTGKWIRTRTMRHDGELYCDQCEQEHPEQKIIWNFCPNCGARMVQEGEDNG